MAVRRRCRLCGVGRWGCSVAVLDPLEVIMARPPAAPDFERLMEAAGIELAQDSR
jgi:hypothetical protein